MRRSRISSGIHPPPSPVPRPRAGPGSRQMSLMESVALDYASTSTGLLPLLVEELFIHPLCIRQNNRRSHLQKPCLTCVSDQRDWWDLTNSATDLWADVWCFLFSIFMIPALYLTRYGGMCICPAQFLKSECKLKCPGRSYHRVSNTAKGNTVVVTTRTVTKSAKAAQTPDPSPFARVHSFLKEHDGLSAGDIIAIVNLVVNVVGVIENLPPGILAFLQL
jgi:hypothetical protein